MVELGEAMTTQEEQVEELEEAMVYLAKVHLVMARVNLASKVEE